MTSRIITVYRVIVAIRKHIEPGKALARGSKAVCVEEAADGGVIISALEVIEVGFFDEGLSLRAIWGGFMLVKKLIKLRSGRTITLPEAILSARAERMQRHARGEDSESLPPLDSPHSNGQKGVPFWISPPVILSAAKNPYPWYYEKS